MVSDGSRAYKTAIDSHLPHAHQVLDRFHVVRWFAARLTAVRRDIGRRPEGAQPVFDPDVFRARFALLRRGDQLTEAQTAHIQGSSPVIPGYGPPGTLSRNSTVSTWPRTTTVPSRRWVTLLISTPQENFPSSGASSTPSYLGETRSWPGTNVGDHPTAA